MATDDKPTDDKTEVNDDATEHAPPPADATEVIDQTQPMGSSQPTVAELITQATGGSGSAAGVGPKVIRERFLLEDLMGEGGMGRVYRAQDLRKVEAKDRNPYVAVKVLTGSFASHPQAFVTLQQEAVKSQKLAHPNIVTVYDFDRDGDSIFMTMELLKGDPLDQLIKLEAPFSKEVAVRYFKELCSGLEYAHKRGLVHSDFKPANVFVTTAGVVKILDFGIARAVSGNVLSHDYDVSTLGALTPAYATVEMSEGHPPSFGDDIYALGCVFYEMLTGEHPYERKSAVKAQEAKLKPKKPDVLDAREWKALRAALSLEAGDRQKTIAELQTQYFGQKSSGGTSAITIGAVVALLALVGAGAFFVSNSGEDEPAKKYIEDAKNCLIADDYACAIEAALVARSLAPDNQEAQRLLASARQEQEEQEQEDVVGQRVEAAKNCFIARDFECAIENALVVRSLEPDNAEIQGILERAQLEADEMRAETELANLMIQARTCMESSDYGCAGARLRTVLDKYPNNLQAQNMQDQVLEAQRVAAVTTLLEEAESCFQSGDLDCAEAALLKARAAGATTQEISSAQTTLESARAEEQALAQSRAAEQQRLADQQRNDRIITSLMTEAQECFDRKDYSCSIAKSEAALTVDPNNSRALAMEEQARSAQEQAKRKIVIE